MIIGVGSTNQVKVSAIKELLSQYPAWAGSTVVSVDMPSGASEQPLSLEETIEGARSRAKEAFKGHDLGIGIESGLFKVPHAKTGMMNVCVCVIYDGKDYHMGLSSAFEFPVKAMELVQREGITVNHAFQKVGLTGDVHIASRNGAIGFLTKGRLARKEYVKQAIMMALIHLENSELYKTS